MLDTTHTNNAKKTWALLQTTGGKDEPIIVFMRKLKRTSQHGIQNLRHIIRKQKTLKDGWQINNNICVYIIVKNIGVLSWTGLYKRITRRMSYDKQGLLILRKHLGSLLVLGWCSVAHFLVFCVVFFYVFVLWLVTNVAFVSGLFILEYLFGFP